MYSVKDVAELLGVTPYTVRVYIREGLLKAMKLGRQYRITEEALHDFLTRDQKNNNE